MTNKHQDDFLVEIRTEELPPKALLKLAESFATEIEQRLKKLNLTFNALNFFATPRRLAVLVNNLDSQQSDQLIEKRGPAIAAAFDANNNPTPACGGFAKSVGADVKDLIRIKTDQGEWVGFKQKITGKNVFELLPTIVEDALSALPIPKRMRWGKHDAQFVRPIHSIMMMYGDRVIDASIFGIKTSQMTRAHRFMAEKEIKVIHAKDYETELKKAYVIADFDKRREEIKSKAPAQVNQPDKVLITEELLDEVTGLVEWPEPLLGKFDEPFLKLPKEVLISAMQDHQRYFPVVDKNENLRPYFVTISNIESKDPNRVVRGNERVLRARLADANFFFEMDQKIKLEDRVDKLRGIVFQAKLGTLYEKTERIKQIAKFIAAKINVDADTTDRAALLCKTDLTSDMVNEFPELQGVMGYYYAKHDGEKADVAMAMKEHYQPRFAQDALPENKVAQVIAVADRLDTLVGAFGINQIPTGDKDPYGLRRAALGVLRILIEKKINLDLKEVLQFATHTQQHTLENKEVVAQVLNFMQERLRAWYQEKSVDANVFNAVAALSVSNPLDIHERIKAVQTFKKLKEAEALSIANKRVSNILTKYEERLEAHAIDPAFFENEAEQELAKQLEAKSAVVAKLSKAGNYNEVLMQLAELRKPVDDFFDHVMVMTDNKHQRENRILMLTKLRDLFLQVADIALLQ